MPEIAECYSIADKLPAIGDLIDIEISPYFHSYINKKKTIKKELVGSVMEKPFAYGKSIWIPIVKENKIGFIVSQLGMTGSWSNNQRFEQRSEKHDHLILKGSKSEIIFNDPRRFGKMHLYWGTDRDVLKKEIIKNHEWGLDPFKSSNDELVAVLKKGWANKNQPIKKLLLEQNLIFGIGNYLASEVLFKAKLNPYLFPRDLKDVDLKKLIKSIKFIISKALKSGGFSFAGGYLLPDGSYGNYKEKVLIYGQEKCPVCRSKVTKSFIAERATFYCKKCQKK